MIAKFLGAGDHFFAFIPIQKSYINTVKAKLITAATSRIVMDITLLYE